MYFSEEDMCICEKRIICVFLFRGYNVFSEKMFVRISVIRK
jgi:hypothetical protein